VRLLLAYLLLLISRFDYILDLSVLFSYHTSVLAANVDIVQDWTIIYLGLLIDSSMCLILDLDINCQTPGGE